MIKDLPELKMIRDLTLFADDLIQVEELDRINVKNKSFPIVAFSIGSKDKSAPTLGLFGGVHGLERVGTHVILSYLDN